MAKQTVYIKLEPRGPTTQSIDRDVYASFASYLKDAVEEYAERQGKQLRITRMVIGGFTSDGLKVDYEYETGGVGPQSLELAVIIIQVLSNWKALVGVIAAIASLILLLKMMNMKATLKVGSSLLTIDPDQDNGNHDDGSDYEDGESDEIKDTTEKKSALPRVIGWGVLIAFLSKAFGAW